MQKHSNSPIKDQIIFVFLHINKSSVLFLLLIIFFTTVVNAVYHIVCIVSDWKKNKTFYISAIFAWFLEVGRVFVSEARILYSSFCGLLSTTHQNKMKLRLKFPKLTQSVQKFWFSCKFLNSKKEARNRQINTPSLRALLNSLLLFLTLVVFKVVFNIFFLISILCPSAYSSVRKTTHKLLLPKSL